MNEDMNDMLRNDAEIVIIGIAMVYTAVLMYVWWF